MSDPFRYWFQPKAEEVGDSTVEFLNLLGGPAHLHIAGRDSSRRRAVVTLLHGNEPSGAIAIHRLLMQARVPAVDMHCFIINIKAALEPPGFCHRMLPDTRDLNRCFGPSYIDDEAGRVTKNLLDLLNELQPECVIDIHNTSGAGPAFSVTTFMDARHDALASLFTHRLIVTDLKLGALMEISETLCPTVTIECGGAQEEASHRLAEEGLEKYFVLDNTLALANSDFDIEYFRNPVRLELKTDLPVYYGEQSLDPNGLTLKTDIETHNFGEVTPETKLGFLARELFTHLSAENTQGEEKLFECFQVVDNVLRPKRDLRLFMVTGNPVIAKSDCLFYFIPT